MELMAWIDTLLAEFPGLIADLRRNLFPSSFLTKVFHLKPEILEKFPDYLLGFIAFYYFCGLVTVILRFARGQKSLSSRANQVSNVLLTCCCIFFVPVLILLVKTCGDALGTVAPFTGEGSDLLRFAGQSLASIFYIVMAIAGVAFTVWMPLSSFLRYLRVYHLGGLPHAIFDIGTGPFLLSVVLLSAHRGERTLLALALPAVVLLLLVQLGGYIPAERNTSAATSRGVSKEQRN